MKRREKHVPNVPCEQGRRMAMAVQKTVANIASKENKKRDTNKKRKKPPMEKRPSSEIALPAFGLAEDILGEIPSKDGGQGEDRNNQELCGTSQHAPGPEGETHDSSPQVHLVTFTLEKEEFAVDIDRVQEIIRVGQITPVPNTPEFIDGVINLRGKVIPVFNLRRRLNLADGELTKHSRIMIVETKTRVLGMLVDAVQQVLWLPAASVEAPPEEAGSATAKVKGIGKLESRLLLLMDLDRVLAKEALPEAA